MLVRLALVTAILAFTLACDEENPALWAYGLLGIVVVVPLLLVYLALLGGVAVACEEAWKAAKRLFVPRE